jgi:hypothetical protein
MVVVAGHVSTRTMMRTLLDCSAGDTILVGLVNLGVTQFVGWLCVTFASGFGAVLDSLVGGLSVGGALELHLKTIHMSGVCVCVLASGYNWGTVMHEIPISSFPILMTSLPYPRTQ